MAIDLEKLEKQLREGEVPAGLAGAVDSVDPSTILIILWAGRLSRRVDAFYQEALRPYALQYSDYAVMSILRFSGAMSPKQLNSFLVITSGGLTKTLQRLEKKKMLVRRADPEDGRGTLLSLSKVGEYMVDKLFVEDVRAHEQMLSKLSATNRQRIAKALRELLDVFEGEH